MCAAVTPFSSFRLSSLPVSPSCPSSVGRVRADLRKDASASAAAAAAAAAASSPSVEAMSAITASVISSTLTTDKKEKKTHLSSSLTACSSLLCRFGDPSIVDIEVHLDGDCVVASDGLVCSQFLDAGASCIVLDVRAEEDVSVIIASHLPKDRLIVNVDARHVSTLASSGIFRALAPFASAYCIDWVTMEAASAGIYAPAIVRLANEIKDASAASDSSSTPPPAPPPATTPLSHSHSHDDDDYKFFVTLPFSFSQSPSSLKLVNDLFSSRVGVCVPDASAEWLGQAFAACAKTDRPDKLYTTVVCTRSGVALGLVYSSIESISAALMCGRGVYYSRSRNGLWRKGDSSGHYQVLHRIDLDCDGDAIRFLVTQMGDDVSAFCHLNTLTCWGKPNGVTHLEEVLCERLKNAPEGSYTKRLFEDEVLLRNKLVEEAQELSEAVEKKHVAEELADVLYFAMVRAVKAGVSIDDAVRELDIRSKKVTRRPGNSKDYRITAAAEILGKGSGGGGV